MFRQGSAKMDEPGAGSITNPLRGRRKMATDRLGVAGCTGMAIIIAGLGWAYLNVEPDVPPLAGGLIALSGDIAPCPPTAKPRMIHAVGEPMNLLPHAQRVRTS
jgi:hypothetical protein